MIKGKESRKHLRQMYHYLRLPLHKTKYLHDINSQLEQILQILRH